jgi:type IV secretory pathway protease TraF
MVSPRTSYPPLLWNASPSVPVGLYLFVLKAPVPGELAVIRLPDTVRTLAAVHGYLAPAALLVKPVAASPGDIVCRHRATVTINGRAVAQARTADEAGRLLPGWSGCITLVPEQVFVLSAEPGSFDGRYFGPLDRVHVLGSAHAVWVTKVDGHPTVPLRQRSPP